MQNAIVLVIDGLANAFIGPYGNTWLATPAWDRLASRSLLLENAITDSPDLATVYHSYWQGHHALTAAARHTLENLPAQSVAASIDTCLITDEPTLADHPIAQDFEQRVILAPPTADQMADAIEQTHLARLFATALELLDQVRPPFLIWIHAQALHGPWDAPYSMRCHFAAEEDPPPPDFVQPPQQRLVNDYDPDQVLGVQQACAGQITLLDTCLGVLTEAVEQHALADSTALLATSPRGYPLGEHLQIGPGDGGLFNELIHVPWLIQLPNEHAAATRHHQLVQPPDMYTTLLNWLDIPIPSLPTWGRDLLALAEDCPPSFDWDQAATSGHGQDTFCVPHWSLHQVPDGPPQLFVKPDDRWEVNNISDRCHDIVQQMNRQLERFRQAAGTNDRSLLPALPTDLTRSYA